MNLHPDLVVIIAGNAFRYSGEYGNAGTGIVHMAVNADGTLPSITNLDNWSGEVEPPYDQMVSAADRALHALHNDAHLRTYLEELVKPKKLSPRAAWPFPGDDKS
jgi:hypothetical protein